MAATINVNKRTVVHKTSEGISSAFPDVCKTPTGAGPVPIPYPNVARSVNTAHGSKTVFMDGHSIMLKGSDFSTSTGDEAGTAGGGVASGRIKGMAIFVNYSFDVMVEGKNVPRLSDLMIQNKGSPANTPSAPVIQPGIPEKDKQKKPSIEKYQLILDPTLILLSPFNKYKLDEPEIIEYNLMYEKYDIESKPVISCKITGQFMSDKIYTIELTKKQYDTLQNVFIWSKRYGSAAFVTRDAFKSADESAKGRLRIKRNKFTKEIGYKPKTKSTADTQLYNLVVNFGILKSVLIYTIEEIDRNLNSENFREIKKVNEEIVEIEDRIDAIIYTDKYLKNLVDESKFTDNSRNITIKDIDGFKTQQDKKIFLAEMLWARKVHKNEGLEGMLEDLVFLDGGEWDHKPIIRRVWGAKNRLGNDDDIYYYDLWSNLHFGYVGRRVGFTKVRLIYAANIAQKFDDLISNLPLVKSSYDPIDDISAQIAFDMPDFDYAAVVKELKSNNTFWLFINRKQISESKEKKKSIINSEFRKRGIPLPTWYKNL